MKTEPSRPASPSDSEICAGEETLKQFLTRHSAKITARHHIDLRDAFTQLGYIVKRVRRASEEPIWDVILQKRSAPDSGELRVLRRQTAKVLRKLGNCCSARQVAASRNRDRLISAFEWPVGRGGSFALNHKRGVWELLGSERLTGN